MWNHAQFGMDPWQMEVTPQQKSYKQKQLVSSSPSHLVSPSCLHMWPATLTSHGLCVHSTMIMVRKEGTRKDLALGNTKTDCCTSKGARSIIHQHTEPFVSWVAWEYTHRQAYFFLQQESGSLLTCIILGNHYKELQISSHTHLRKTSEG